MHLHLLLLPLQTLKTMWEKIAGFVLRNRLWLVIALVAATALMLFQASKVELNYGNPKFVPDNDPEMVAYKQFQATFGDDGSVLVFGINTPKINELAFFQDWHSLTRELDTSTGIEQVLSITNVPNLTIGSEKTYNEEEDTTYDRPVFIQEEVFENNPKSQAELDSLFAIVKNLKFYEGLLYNSDSDFSLIAVTLEKKVLDSKARIGFVKRLVARVNKVAKKHEVEVHYSGLPYIRTVMSNRIKEELKFFTLLSLGITALILLIFFRSFKTTLFSLLVVIIGVVWSFGILVLLGYKVTMFIGLIPPLIVVIGIANCIYLLNKYHEEYKTHKNQIKALQRVISKVGLAVFFTNLTTAIGFGVFVLTGSQVLKEFGLTAFLSVMSVYIISIILIPVIFSFLPKPKARHTGHLDSKLLSNIIDWISNTVRSKRKTVYITAAIVVLIAIVGMMRIKVIGFMVDDIAESDPLYKDLKFFEKNINGVLPFEIVIDTKKEGGINDPKLLNKIDYFERNKLSQYGNFSKPISIAQVIKFARQALHEGDARFYRVPGNLELSKIMAYMPSGDNEQKGNMIRSLLDSNNQKARISVQIADVGSVRIEELKDSIGEMADSIFNFTKTEEEIYTDSIIEITIDTFDDVIMADTEFFSYPVVSYEPVDTNDEVDVYLTGTSIIFLKGNAYLVKNLLSSLLIAFLIIGMIMATLFVSFRMIVISLVPNIIPLLITAGIMGHFHVALKPSTVLVFSVAFGIAVDFTIHFLSKYRMELKKNNYDMPNAVAAALKETGVSIIYTAIILFFGFIIFANSKFGGTIALGVFTSITLVVGLMCNLILLPSLLLSYDLAKERKKNKQKPLIKYPDEFV
jgi:uncharacterized protein